MDRDTVTQDPADYAVLGVGALAEAIVTGLCEGVAEPPSIALSPRSASRSGALAERFATVRVEPDNQAVVDSSDVVIVSVRPQDAVEVLEPLSFRPGQSVVSVMAGLAIEDLAPLVSPATELARSAPMPAVAGAASITPVHPRTDAAAALFERLGGVLDVPSEPLLERLFTASATVAAHYAYLATIAGWLAAEGLPAGEADQYVAGLFAGVAEDLRSTSDLHALADSHATAGGINESFRELLTEADVYTTVTATLDRVHAHGRRLS